MPKSIPRAWVNYMNKYFSKVSWETNDLLSCKQAYKILRREYSVEELIDLDFDNLDIWAIEEEANPQLELDHRSVLEAIDYLEGGQVKDLHFNADKNQYEGTVYVAYPSYLYDGDYDIVYEEKTVTYSIEYGQQILSDYRQFMGDLPF